MESPHLVRKCTVFVGLSAGKPAVLTSFKAKTTGVFVFCDIFGKITEKLREIKIAL